MQGKNFMILVCTVFIVIIVSLFIELSYNKSHAKMVFLAPETILVIKAKELNCLDDVIVYNTSTTSLEQAMKKIPKSKRSKYMEKPIEMHISRRISKPFNDSYKEIKGGYCSTLPVSLIYKTGVGLADLVHNITSDVDNTTPYRLLIINEKSCLAFMDSNNIYLK